MGECRVRIVIARSLFTEADLQSSPLSTTTTEDDTAAPSSALTSDTTISFARLYNSDTTVREVFEGNVVLWKLLRSNSDGASSFCRLWDCSLYPPFEITSWPLEEFPDLQGPRSKTLHSAGWFPSGTILVIPKNMTPNHFSDVNVYIDNQYNTTDRRNLTQDNANRNSKVEFQDNALRSSRSNGQPLLPSQVMSSVANRFANDETMSSSTEHADSNARMIRQQNKQQQARKEQERATKLEARIARLEEQSEDTSQKKNKKVSEQVWRMLVKSRATGDKNLKMMDRVYFQCLVLREVVSSGDTNNEGVSSGDTNNEGGTKEYRYFSPQDSFAKIASTFATSSKVENILSEVLCRRTRTSSHTDHRHCVNNNKEEVIYRRFPVTMRVYEAIDQAYLNDKDQVSTLIVRWYSDREDITPSVLEDVSEPETDAVAANTPTAFSFAESVESVEPIQDDAPTPSNDNTSVDRSISIEFEDIALADAIRKMDSVNEKGKKTAKKSSTAAMKVKQMTMKSKSQGDARRVSKLENRFFMEVVTITKTGSASSTYFFLAKKDPIERILQYCTAASEYSSPQSWDFLVQTENEGCFRSITTTSIMTQEAAEQGILKPFGRLILRRRQQ